ncbi:hypothetical protein [Nonomuraea rubra]|uniref:Putative membrane protein n=1 Tax=Nonomuraea rubra TaxID=46180 RepID=A0A7X0U0G5_9ACTN|nr:hypothetical protein [Nonomuraea rubra]MBB6550349.1 putative membrane protein [Nonomuraea rubra]
MTCTHAGMAVDAAVGGGPIARFAATGTAVLLIALGIAAPSIRQDSAFWMRGVLGMPGDADTRMRALRFASRLLLGSGAVVLIAALIAPEPALLPVMLAAAVLPGPVAYAYAWRTAGVYGR